MDFNIILLFKSSLMNYLNSVGIKIKESDIKMFNSNNDICIYSRQFVDETIHHLLYNMKEEQYQLSISKIFINKCKLSIDLNRSLTFTCGLKLIFSQSSLCSFGNTNLHKNKLLNIICDNDNNFNDLTNYRVKLLTEITKNLASAVGYSVHENISNAIQGLYFSNKSNLLRDIQSNHKIIVCGPVLNNDHKTKETAVTVNQLKNMKKNIYQNENNEEVNNLLCDAVIKFDFIRVKVNSSVILNFSSSVAGSVVFILYNYSRLNAIILEFESRVLKNYYPPLPLAEFVDFSVLKLEKEWNLMFHFVLNFPNVIRNTMEYIEEGKPSPHLLCTFLYSLARTVSSYYRSTKILLDGKSHLLPIIYARLYLLKAVHLILSTGLKLLNIEVIPAL